MRLPLEDVKVLDLSHALAGPFCSTMLADFGAQVIKLEPRGAGDIARAWGPPLPGGETSYFVSLHRNKKGIDLDLKHPQGKEVFFRLVERCDVVLENYRFGALAKLGLAYEVARTRNPGIIYCSVSGFGQDGPYRERAALDLILQAESGMISVTGEEGSHGVRCGVSIADLTAGMYAAFGIMLALRAREKTGRGQAIDVSMLEGQLSLLGTMIGGYLADGELPEPMGTAYKALLPYQTFRTKTRDLALAVGSEKLWKVFCPVIGCPELADDPRYRTNADRARNRESLVKKLQQVFLTKTYEDWEAVLLASGIPVGAINNLAQVVEHPQVKARNVLVEMAHPRAGKVRMVGAPVRLSETPGSVRTPAPMLGEHTDEVLGEVLGLASAEIDALRSAGAIGPRPKQRPSPRPTGADEVAEAPGKLVGGGER
jgi:crotonobetainyl-CoA:carnitine CoA-transferase CaiB-like acyl-CoA transferase